MALTGRQLLIIGSILPGIDISMKQGFTFIETILYVAVIAIMMTALIPFVGNLLINSSKSMAQQEVSSNARIVSEKIKYEIRKATAFTVPASNQLSLNSGATVITLSSGQVTINSVPINSADTIVSNLIFENLTTGVRYSFTIGSNFGGTRSEYQSSMFIEGSAQIRI